MKKESTIHALVALTEGMVGRTKIAQLREVFPYIEAARQAGFKNAKILETLNAQGFDLSLKSFEMMLYRIREKNKTEGAPKTQPSATQALNHTPHKQIEEGGKTFQGESFAGLDKKQRRERLADQFITPELTNPLLKKHFKDQPQ